MARCTPNAAPKPKKPINAVTSRKLRVRGGVASHDQDEQTAREKASAETGAVVRDYGNQHRRDGCDLVTSHGDKGKVLRHEDRGHAHNNDRAAGQNETECTTLEEIASVTRWSSVDRRFGLPRLLEAESTWNRAAGAPEAGKENREENYGGHRVPGVEITVAEIGEETREASGARDGKRPPRPTLAVFQREFRQPPISGTDGEERCRQTPRGHET